MEILENVALKVKKELLPCLRSFTSSLRVAEMVWKEGVLIKDFPPEAFTIKCLEDSWALLKTEDGQKRFEEYLRQWMKKIQELLLESEQLRLETDDAGPQVVMMMIMMIVMTTRVPRTSWNTGRAAQPASPSLWSRSTPTPAR